MELYKIHISKKLNFLLRLLAIFISYIISHSSYINHNFIYDISNKLFRYYSPNPTNIYIIEISDKDLLYFNSYPIKREYYLKVLRNIRNSGVIGIDILYTGESDIDKELGEEIRRKGNVVLSKTIVNNINLPTFYNQAAGVGHTFIPLDSKSNMVRESPIVYGLTNSFSEVISTLYELNGYSLVYNQYDLPVWKSDFNVISFKDMLSSPRDFNNGIVLIGYTASYVGDSFNTPISNNLPGVYIHANYIYNSINKIGINRLHIPLIFLFLITLIFLYIPISISLLISILFFFVFLFNKYYLNIELFIISTLLYLFLKLLVYIYIVFKSLEKISITDELTSLLNRRAFNIFSKGLWKENSYILMVISDIDNFKKYNDHYGHQKGDIVLKQVALAIKKNVINNKVKKKDGYVFRIGGEEFVYIKKYKYKPTEKTLNEFLYGINKKIYDLHIEHIDNNNIGYVTVSLGAVCFKPSSYTMDYVFDIADKNLYLSKTNGRNRFTYNII